MFVQDSFRFTRMLGVGLLLASTACSASSSEVDPALPHYTLGL